MKVRVSNKSWILLSTTIIIGIAFSVYFLVYVKGKERTIVANNFRVLDQIVQNIKSLEKSYIKNAGASFSAIKVEPDGDVGLNQEADVNRNLSPIWISKFRKEEGQEFSSERNIYFGNNGLYFQAEKGQRVIDTLIFKTDYLIFFDNRLIQRRDIFDQILIIKAGSENNGKKVSKRVLFSNGRMGIMDSVFYTKAMPSARDEITINDTKYISFNQIVNEHENIYISGLVLKSNFEQQKRSVAPFTVSFLSIILILIILSIPLLKLKIMSLEERLHIKDVIFTVVSLLIGPAVLIIFFYTSIGFVNGKTIPKSIKYRLNSLSAQIESRFNDELESIARQTKSLNEKFYKDKTLTTGFLYQAFDTTMLKKSFKETVHFPKENYGVGDFYVFKDVLESKDINTYRHIKSAFWADAKGNSRVVLSAFKKPSYGQTLGHRKYLMNIVNGKPTHFRGKNGDYELAIESIKSVNDGSYEVGVGMSTGCGDCLLPVFAISSKLNSVMDVVLEEGYGFCIIDKEGNTMFHSDKLKNLNENFIEETDGVFDFTLSSGTAQHKTVNYNGKKQSIFLRPLNGLSDHYIATFVNTQVYYGPFTLSMISSFVLFLSYISLLFCVYLIAYAITYRPTKLKQMVNIFSFLRPYETNRHLVKYKKLLPVLGVVVLYLAISCMLNCDRYDYIMSELVLISLVLLIFIYISLSSILPEQEIMHTAFLRYPERAIKTIAAITFAFFVIRAIYLIFSIQSLGIVINVIAGLLVIAFILKQTIVRPDKEEALNDEGSIETSERIHKAFKLCMFMLVIIFSIIPINLFLKIIFDKEDQVFAKYRGLELLRKSESWADNIRAEFKGKFSAISDSVFFASMEGDQDYLYVPNLPTIVMDSIADIPAAFEREIEKGLVSYEDSDHGKTLKREASEHIFDQIYSQIRPIYNDRSRVTSNYLPDFSSDAQWLFHVIDRRNVVSLLHYNGSGVLLSQVKITKESFFKDYWVIIVAITAISLVVLMSFLNFILTRIYGFKFKRYAFSVSSFNGENFSKTFLDKRFFSNSSSYNNLFVVGVNVAHKDFILDYFTQQAKDAKLLILDLDDFYEQPKNIQEDAKRSFRDFVKVRQHQGEGEVVEKDWREIENYYFSQGDPVYLLIEHFEFGYNDLHINKMKLQLLKYLVDCEKFKVIIKSEINATKLLDFYNDSINRIETLLKDKSIGDRIKLMEMLSDFKVDYKKWQHMMGSFVKCIIPINQLSQDRELQHGEFLNMLHKYLGETKVLELPEDDKVLTIQQMSYPYYFSVWNSLSKAERYIVYDIAKDRFVNTVNTNGIISLLNKGILIYDHSLRLMNDSFANFVLTTVSSDEALEMEMESKKKGSWNTAFAVIVLLIISLVIFLSIGQQSFLNDINAFLTSIAALIGLLIRFSGLLTFGGNKAPAA